MKSKRSDLLAVALALLISLSLARSAGALEPQQIALIVNSNEPHGRELAEFYAQARHIPDNRILELNVTPGDEISFSDYQQLVIPQVRDFLRDPEIARNVRCLVTFYGVPLRIAARINSPDDLQELDNLRKQILDVIGRTQKPLGELETLAQSLDRNFQPGKGSEYEEIRRRTDLAVDKIRTQIATIPDDQRRQDVINQLYGLLGQLTGDMARAQRMADESFVPTTQPTSPLDVEAFRRDFQAVLQSAGELERQPNDPQTRQKLRELIAAHLGLFGQYELLRDQIAFFGTQDTASAFDSELALVQWPNYPYVGWVENPFFYRAKKRPPGPTFLVMRLDAPRPETVKQLISDSIGTEQNGLKGQIVLDSRGLSAEKANTEPDRAMAMWDQTIRDLGDLVRQHTTMKILEDDKPEVLPANSANDVALYCGWYSLRNYVDECKFDPGAVGYHIASFELLTLHSPNETGWVAGLLNHGVAATLGPVAEPYVEAFPRPDDFFPLLLTGKLCLADVYWVTVPMASWRLSAIGDPLYNPYKTNPQLKIRDLPERLKPIFQRTGRPLNPEVGFHQATGFGGR